MSRPRAGTAVLRKGRDRVQSILDAATAILIADGYAGFSARKVAARAGVRLGHLQYYFPTKQDVVRALLDRYLARATASVAERVAAAPTASGRLDALLDVVLADQRDAETSRFFWELWALAARDAAVADAMQAFYRGYWLKVVAAMLDVEPGLGRARAERRAALLVATLEGLSLFRSRTASRELPLPLLERELRGLARRLATDLGG